MQEFVGARYVREVLAPAIKGGSLPDLFARYGLDLEDRDSAAIGARLAEVKDYWHLTEDRNPKYHNLIKRLLEEHSTARITLTDAGARAEAAQHLLTERARAQADRQAKLEEFETNLQSALARAKGLSSRDRALLEVLGRDNGLDEQLIASRLDACEQVSEPSPEQSPESALPEGAAHMIRHDLRSYAELVGRPRDGVSLFHFLGFDGVVGQEKILARWTEMSAAVRTVRVSYRQELTSRLLSYVKTHLIDGEALRYLTTLTAEVAEEIRPDLARATLDDGEIDPAEAEQLVNGAQQHGLDVTQARALVTRLAHDMHVQVVLGAVTEYISCAACNQPHVKTGSPPRCRRCGEALFLRCPGCNQSNPASSAACPSCGRNLAADAAARHALSEARELLESGAPMAARQLLADAEQVLADDAELSALATATQRAIEDARASWAEAERAIVERRLHTAASTLRRLMRSARDLPGNSGRLPTEELAALEARLQDAQTSILEARRRPPPQRELALTQVLEQVADSQEAIRELAAMPPRPPASLRASVADRSIVLEWQASPSPGDVRYRLLRVIGRNPTIAGAAALASTSDTTYSDADAPQGELVSYGVVCERAGSSAPPVWAPPIVVAYEVDALEIIDGDGQVEVRFAAVGAGGYVEVLRSEARGGAETALSPGATGIVDRDVVNGTRYRYRVRVVYQSPDGEAAATVGRSVYGSPAARPQPLMDLSVESSSGEVRLRYAPPVTGSVTVIRCAQEPEAQCGEQLSVERLESIGEVLPATGEGARDPAPGRLAWYLPVTVAGGYAIAGLAVRHAQIPAVENVSIADYRSEVRVTWSWPQDVRTSRVLWREDRRPKGPDDPQAMSREITLAKYAESGGIELPAQAAQTLFVAVYACMRIDGELIVGTDTGRGSHASVSRRSKVEVRYEMQRRGLRGRRLLLLVTAPVDQPLPELVVVARGGEIMPRSQDDGKILARLGGSSGVAGRQLDLGAIERPVALRLFLAAEHLTATHRVLDPDSGDLILR
jgi:hypothetical protein